MIVECAPAKVNLFLHVGPVREDGLHELASLFFFTNDGDRLNVEPAKELHLEIKGPFAEALADEDIEQNLIIQAAKKLRHVCGETKGARITLEKCLPVAAGIGGGSADAAATLRALQQLWQVTLPERQMMDLAFSLGADVPACLTGAPIIVTGAGECIDRLSAFPDISTCMVNPGVTTPTGPIFKAFDADNPSPLMPDLPNITNLYDTAALEHLASTTQNHLQKYAIDRVPVIGEAIELLASCEGAIGARMSGSGATVFALFANKRDAQQAAHRATEQGWWAAAMDVNNQTKNDGCNGGMGLNTS